MNCPVFRPIQPKIHQYLVPSFGLIYEVKVSGFNLEDLMPPFIRLPKTKSYTVNGLVRIVVGLNV